MNRLAEEKDGNRRAERDGGQGQKADETIEEDRGKGVRKWKSVLGGQVDPDEIRGNAGWHEQAEERTDEVHADNVQERDSEAFCLDQDMPSVGHDDPVGQQEADAGDEKKRRKGWEELRESCIVHAIQDESQEEHADGEPDQKMRFPSSMV